MLIKADEHGMFPIEPIPGGVDFSEHLDDVISDVIGVLQNSFSESEVGPPRAYFEAKVHTPEGGVATKIVPYVTIAYKIKEPFRVEDFAELRKDLVARVLLLADGDPVEYRLIWRMNEKIVRGQEYDGYKVRTRVAVVPLHEAVVV